MIETISYVIPTCDFCGRTPQAISYPEIDATLVALCDAKWVVFEDKRCACPDCVVNHSNDTDIQDAYLAQHGEHLDSYIILNEGYAAEDDLMFILGEFCDEHSLDKATCISDTIEIITDAGFDVDLSIVHIIIKDMEQEL